MPTTVIIDVKPDGGGDYDDLSAAIIAEARDLVAADETIIFDCYDSTTPVETGLVSPSTSTWTTDATHRILIRAAEGNGHSGFYSDEVARIEGNGGSVQALVQFFDVQGMIIYNTATTGFSSYAARSAGPNGAATDFRLIDCILMRSEDAPGNGVQARGPLTMINCAVISSGTAMAGAVVDSGDNISFYNCTFLCKSGVCFSMADADPTVVVKNCYCFGESGSNDYNNIATSKTEVKIATADTSSPITALRSIAYNSSNFRVGVDIFEYDARLALAASDLADEADDVSAENGGITTDFQGQERDSMWDIGADEVGDPEAPGGTSSSARNVTPILRVAQTRRIVGASL